MKALSLKQPFAELILQGRKKIELRKWNTKFRGEFLIHASKIPDWDAMKKFGFENLPCGFIVGKAKLVKVKNYKGAKSEFEKNKKLHLADESWGDFGFVLKNSERINPIPAKGNLGFWNFNLSKLNSLNFICPHKLKCSLQSREDDTNSKSTPDLA